MFLFFRNYSVEVTHYCFPITLNADFHEIFIYAHETKAVQVLGCINI